MSSQRRTECCCHHLSEAQGEQWQGSVPARAHTAPGHEASAHSHCPTSTSRKQIAGHRHLLSTAGMGTTTSSPQVHPAGRHLPPAVLNSNRNRGKSFSRMQFPPLSGKVELSSVISEVGSCSVKHILERIKNRSQSLPWFAIRTWERGT